MFRSQIVRFPVPLSKADLAAIARIEAEEGSQIVGARVGFEGGIEVRSSSGEVYSLEAFRARRRRSTDQDPLPPAGAAAVAAA